MTNNSTEERDMRAALQYAVAQICTEEEMTSEAANMSSSAIQSLSELLYQFATVSVSKDLTAFSKHAGRRTITLDDVYLLVRRNKHVSRKLQKYAEDNNLTRASKRNSSSGTTAVTSTSPRSRTSRKTVRNKEFERQCQSMMDSTQDSSDSDNDERKPAAKEVFRLESMDDSGGSESEEAEFEDEKENKQEAAGGESIEIDLDSDTEDEDTDNQAPLRKRLKKIGKKSEVAKEQPPPAKKPLGITTSFPSDDSLDELLLNR